MKAEQEADPAPMDPEELANLRWMVGSPNVRGYPTAYVEALLADRDYWEREAGAERERRGHAECYIAEQGIELDGAMAKVDELRGALEAAKADAAQWRARCPVTAKDVERSGLSSAQARAWIRTADIDEDLAADFEYGGDLTAQEIAELCHEAHKQPQTHDGHPRRDGHDGGRIMKRSRVNPRNADRKAKLHARNFGKEAERVRAGLCVVGYYYHAGYGGDDACHGPMVIAHNPSRGAGGGRFDIVGMCQRHHDVQHQKGVKTFEVRYPIDLRAEADRIALEHLEPLGIRGLAARWSPRPAQSAAMWDPEDPLDGYETEALLGWVRRRMAREVERRQAEHSTAMLYASVAPDGCEPDGLPSNDREALAHAVAHDLGGDFTTDPHGEHGLAWSLCEAAGWPS